MKNQVFNALKSINYWTKSPKYNIGFLRVSYTERIKRALGNTLIKVLTGQRRVGKSYIMRQLMDSLVKEQHLNPKNILYLNMEMYELSSVSDADALAQLIGLYEAEIQPNGKVYIFIDEIQTVSGWEKLAASLAQHPVKAYELIISGSNSQLLSGELATHIAGRYISFEIFPFSYLEFLEFYKLENTKQNFIKYFETSGLPEIFNLPDDEIRKHYFQSLKDTVLLKDIMHRHKIRDYVLLEDLFLFLVHNVGNLTSVGSVIKYFKSKNRKIDFTTISQYLSYIEEAFIAQHAPRYHLKTKELLSGECKYYVNDLGFRNYLFPKLKRDFAAILENIVFTHLRTAGYKVYTGNTAQSEIDFIAEKDDTFIYLQISYLMESESTIKREFGAFEKIADNYPKYVLSMDDLLLGNPDGIRHEQIWLFIENLLKQRLLS